VPSEDSWSPATSLAEQIGREIDIAHLRWAILEALAAIYGKWLEGEDMLETARSTVGTIGRRVAITMKSGGVLDGVAHDIESTGGLVLELGDRRLVLDAENVERLREV
jgi:biotin-(acetyl-CoA carboxylase) ligase